MFVADVDGRNVHDRRVASMIVSNRSAMRSMSKVSTAYAPSRGAELGSQIGVVGETFGGGDQCRRVARRHDDSGPGSGDVAAGEVLGRHRAQDRAPGAVVGQHLRRHREGTGVGFEQHQQHVGRGQHLGQLLVRLEREQIERVVGRGVLGQPRGADAFGGDDHAHVRATVERHRQVEQHGRLVLEAERARIEEHDLVLGESVPTGPLVAAGLDRELVERSPILDHGDLA